MRKPIRYSGNLGNVFPLTTIADWFFVFICGKYLHTFHMDLITGSILPDTMDNDQKALLIFMNN